MSWDEETNEQDLLERARVDPEAFSELFQRHVGQLHRMAALRTGTSAAADHVTTATFERAVGEVSTHEWTPGGVTSWLGGLAIAELAAAEAPGNAVLDRITELKPVARDVLTLTYLGGLNDAEVAEAVDRSRATVAITLQRAVEAVGQGTDAVAALEAVSASPVAEPDPAFVSDLDARLRSLHAARPTAPAGRTRRRPGRRTLVLITLGVLAALALVLLAGGGPPTVELIDGADLTIVLPDGNEIDAEPGLGVPPGTTVITGTEGFAVFESGRVGADATATVFEDRIEIVGQPDQP